jgi:uncharacterized protein with von Willebrand factor type A (vWA) domain
MARGIENDQAGTSPAHDLEPYRRLVELQKEITELAQQNDNARRNCEQLRDHVASDVLSQSAAGPVTRMAGALAQMPLGLFVSSTLSRILKQP